MTDGYSAQYGTGDFVDLLIDFFAAYGYQMVILAGIIALLTITVWIVSMLKKIMRGAK